MDDAKAVAGGVVVGELVRLLVDVPLPVRLATAVSVRLAVLMADGLCVMEGVPVPERMDVAGADDVGVMDGVAVAERVALGRQVAVGVRLMLWEDAVEVMLVVQLVLRDEVRLLRCGKPPHKALR